MKLPRKGSLLWKLFALSFVQIALVTVAALVLPRMVLGPRPKHKPMPPPHHESFVHDGPQHHDEPSFRSEPPFKGRLRDPGGPPDESPDDRFQPPEHYRVLLPILTFGWGFLIVGLGSLDCAFDHCSSKGTLGRCAFAW
ncbi:MAG: hypothetical protein R3A47_10930 [Polyangiales bacterium]